MNQNEYKFTWRNFTRNGYVQSRIDYFLISTHMVYDYHSASINPGIKSDHSIIKLTFEIPESRTRGRGFWKFNSTLLKDTEYVKK